ncbi:ribonuclease [Rhodococcus opacus PD630]|uniref:YihY/virulence factor BrkB family protein n=1 Tax=Rhodococcus opacus TaxID=37919 RepID=UPI00029CBF1E|nr:YhjD/YihY/BrkB family envelope integrity protein [Rhodococcus opacus]KXF55359.1 ribonuclease BN [Rhodococcus sp. SC4]RZK69394.1 MAG: ribonuclease BN [Rhodococcus sp. (in: high G+C Gram-positive bacteria)]AHK27592.1 Inner membrane protein yhjD [Rhodococcus opacus PD630]EHI42175.1 ribonuclease [Rhodococcus opacus PD630]UDG97562.1 YihY/virulence factor BrkB family protein [Rhodococcus opacus PD630]
MKFARRLDALQQKYPAMGFPIAVTYKFLDDQGVYLAALIAYYGFISLFPLLLLLSTVLGFVLSGHPELQQDIIDSALSQFPVIGADLADPHRIGGGVTGLVIGLVGALYGGLGVALASQNAMNTAWSVPRNMRPDPIRGRLRGLLLLGTIGLAVLGTAAVAAVGAATHLSGSFTVLLMLAAITINSAIFILAFRLATARPLSVADVAPGAVAAAVVWQVLQSFGAYYVSKVVSTASVTNGVFAVVLGLLAFLFLAAAAIVVCVEINVVRVDRLHPRALLGPFTDKADLVEGDKRTFTDQAKAQRAVAHEGIHVTFDEVSAKMDRPGPPSKEEP